ncbi:DUF11 domain-containing protein [Parasphingorhabdus cellanae]|uniref:DUF11 domain-containing protein n=1 Tax=Parasphingorhabdus cellanae TaxID=2806553 RepID=A0ABX7T6C0_9SPHN|nr:DUF11 domain-containing protein [Parasphingorhabdus cellanae]QTD57076.1 DUF11 domain-containing protein [Parasphingorhabdus cellanae]
MSNLVRLLLGLAVFAMLSVPAQAQTFTADWTNLGVGSIQGVPSGSSVTAGPRTVTVTHTEITDGGPFTNFYGTEMLNYFNGTIGTQNGTLLYSMDNDTFDPDDRFESIFTFDSGVTNLAFAVAHVDSGTSPRSDGVTIEYDTGTGVWQNIRSVPATFTLGAVVGTTTLSGVQGFVGTGSAGGLTSTTGNINVDFGAISVERVRITYHFGQNQTGNPAGNLQYMGLSDFTFQVAGTAVSDLSLAKTVSNATPTSGSAISYTLSLTNNGPVAETSVQVEDILPSGFSFTGAAGFGSYSTATNLWTVPNIASGQTRSITISGTVTAPAGVTITNFAEVFSQTNFDTDSTPGNGSTNEDDDASRSFTVQGTRTAGTPPNFNAICPIVNQTLFDWNAAGVTWTSGTLNNSYTVANIGTINFALSNTGGTYDDGSPEDNSNNTGGLAATEQSLYQNLQFDNRAQVATTVLTLPTAVPSLQFTVFDIDFAANDFADKLTVTGSFNGATVMPTLTNGVVNYVVGNVAVGDGGSNSDSANGNVVVTFSSPVDTITIEYGNAGTAPANPDGQAISIHDINFCSPATTLSVTKISSVISDPVNGTSDPKSIPGATIQYCILISNAGSATASSISATDTIPSNVTYTAASMQSGSNCGSAATAEDDDATGADESDPFGASVSGAVLTATAASLGPAEGYALTFQVTVD